MSLDKARYKEVVYKKLGHGHSVGLYLDAQTDKLALAFDGVVIERFASTGIYPIVASEARGDILRRGASDWEALSAKTDGQILVGDGTDINSVAVSGAVSLDNAGATLLAANLLRVATGTITAADIVATDAGKLGHANGYPLVAAVGTHNVPEFISAALFFDYSTAAYTDGGNVTVNLSGGGAAQSDPVAAANFCGAAADKAVLLRPPTASAGVAMVENAGLNLVAATAFTNPGTAAGVIRYAVLYRVHATGL